MIVISLTFPVGRYHATPWGRHVNEGVVEWPPSPWRLLRSLVAVWKRTLPDVPEADIKPIFETLAATPPRFVLPPASTGHTRHYMPWDKNWKPPAPQNRTLVFDTFVALDPNEAFVRAIWPDAALTDTQRRLLSRLLTNLNFLGRAESWCEAKMLSEQEAASALEDGDLMHADPLDPSMVPCRHDNHELVRTLCPDPATAFADDHVVELETTTQGRGKNKTITQSRRAVYDPNWNLCMETLRLHQQKWSDPPGSRWVTYVRPRDCFDLKPPSHRRASRRDSGRPVHLARFVLDSTVLPLITDTLPIAEAIRRALMSLHGRLAGRDGARGRSAVLAGKDESGSPLLGHGHAYYLPTDEDGDGRLDHLTIYAAAGFGPDEQRAIERLATVNSSHDRDGRHPLRTVLLGTWCTGDLHDGRLIHPFGPASVWESVTPYLATRHAKTRGRERIDPSDPSARARFLVANLLEQLRCVRPHVADLMAQTTIEPLIDRDGAFVIRAAGESSRTLRPLQFKRCRSKTTDDGGRRLAGAFRITFPRPVRGPIALGHSAHFGLGLFFPKARTT